MIRKIYPKMIAEQIVGVQPMSAQTSDLFSLNVLNPWSNWRKTTSIWPRRSINGKIIFGRINKRSRQVWDGPMHGKANRLREFATNKELFASILKGNA